MRQKRSRITAALEGLPAGFPAGMRYPIKGIALARVVLQPDGPASCPIFAANSPDEVHSLKPITIEFGHPRGDKNRPIDRQVIVEDCILSGEVALAPSEDALCGTARGEVFWLSNRGLAIEDHVAQIQETVCAITAILEGRLVVEHQAGIGETGDGRINDGGTRAFAK